MSITYLGTRDFTLQRVTRGEPHFGLKTRQFEYRGEPSKLTAFLASHQTGTSHEAGYIVARDVDEGGPYDTVRLTTAYAPDFNDYAPANSTGIKTASKSAEVNNSSVYNQIAGGPPESGEPIVYATKEVTYYSNETSYRYFASAKPTGARFGGLQISSTTRIIRSRITAQAGQASATYGVSAPAPLVTALVMPVEVKLVSHQAEKIPGTPWWECSDALAAEFVGDS